MKPNPETQDVDLERRRFVSDSPDPARSPLGATGRRHLPPTPMVSDNIFLRIPLPKHPIHPAALARLFSELVETIIERNDSTLLIERVSDGPTLDLAVEQSQSEDIDVDALIDDLRGIVRRFADADHPGTETSA